MGQLLRVVVRFFQWLIQPNESKVSQTAASKSNTIESDAIDNSDDAYMRRGRACSENGDFENAVANFRLALKIAGENYARYYKMSSVAALNPALDTSMNADEQLGLHKVALEIQRRGLQIKLELASRQISVNDAMGTQHTILWVLFPTTFGNPRILLSKMLEPNCHIVFFDRGDFGDDVYLQSAEQVRGSIGKNNEWNPPKKSVEKKRLHQQWLDFGKTYGITQ